MYSAIQNKQTTTLIHSKEKTLSLCWIFVCAMLVRIAWIFCIRVSPMSDYLWYYERALSIAAGNGYAINGSLTGYWPAGYPFYLGALLYLTGGNILAVLFFNVALDIACLYMTYKLAKLWGLEESAATAIAIFFCFYLNHIAYDALLCSEVPFMILFLCGCTILSLRHRQSDIRLQVVSGVVFALAVLIKPIIICFPALFIFFNYEKSRRLRAVSVHYILIALFIMPLTLRNYSIYHEFIPISLNSSVNLFIGNNPYANGTYIYDEKVLSLIGNPGDELTESKRAQRYAVDYIKEHPVRALVLLPRKIYYQYITDVDGISSNLAGVPLEAGATRMFLKASRIVAQAVYVFIVALFFISLYRMIQGAGISAVLKRPPIIVILYFFIMYLPFFGAPRFHYVMMPFILMVAAAQLPKKLVANLKNIFIRRGVVLSS